RCLALSCPSSRGSSTGPSRWSCLAPLKVGYVLTRWPIVRPRRAAGVPLLFVASRPGPRSIFPLTSAQITTPKGEDYHLGQQSEQDAPEGETGRCIPVLKINSATRAFAIVAAYWRNDLDGVLALVGDAELWPIVVEIPAGALLRLRSEEHTSG